MYFKTEYSKDVYHTPTMSNTCVVFRFSIPSHTLVTPTQSLQPERETELVQRNKCQFCREELREMTEVQNTEKQTNSLEHRKVTKSSLKAELSCYIYYVIPH